MKFLLRWAGFPKQYLQRWGNFEVIVSVVMLLAIFSLSSGMFGRWVSSSRLDGFLSIVIQALSKADYSVDKLLSDLPFFDSLSIIENLLTGKNPRSREAPPLATDTPEPTITLLVTFTSTPFSPSTITPSPTVTQGITPTGTSTPVLTPTESPTSPGATFTHTPQNTLTAAPSATSPPVKTPTPTEFPDQTPQASLTPTPGITATSSTSTPTLTPGITNLPPTITPTPIHPSPTATQTPLPPTATQFPSTDTPKPTNTIAPRPTHDPTFALTPTSAYTPGPTNAPPLNPASWKVNAAARPGLQPIMPSLTFGEFLKILSRIFN